MGFWDRVDKSAGSDSCWPWTGARSASGYGNVVVDSKNMNASRRAWILVYGDPGTMLVCHTCDNRLCCNPKHLWIGSNADNLGDMAQKGRSRNHVRLGTENHKHKLTPADVHAIRRRSAAGETNASLARKFGIAPQNVSRIARGLSWSWLSPEVA